LTPQPTTHKLLTLRDTQIPRLLGLAPGVVALTGLSRSGAPTGRMLGGLLAERSLDVPEKYFSLKIEPLRRAPFDMAFGPQQSLRYWRARDWLKSALERAPLPPYA
jgi:hypothetical protein